MFAVHVTDFTVLVADLLEHIEDFVFVRRQGHRKNMFQIRHAVDRIHVHQRFVFDRIQIAFAHGAKFVWGSLHEAGEIFEPCGKSCHILSTEPHLFHFHERSVTVICTINETSPQSIERIFELRVRILARFVQVHGHRKGIAIERINVAYQAVDFADKASLESSEPGVRQIKHALAAGTDSGARKTVDVVAALGVARHLGKQLGLGRRLHLVLGRKSATVPDFEVSRIDPHFGKEFHFHRAAAFDTSDTCFLGAQIAEDRFGMQVLAALIDFVENAEERRRRICIRGNLDSLLHIGLLLEGYPAFLESVNEGSLKVRNRVTHREHQLTGIHADTDGATNRDFGFCRIERPSPLALFTRNRHHFIFQNDIANVRHHFGTG